MKKTTVKRVLALAIVCFILTLTCIPAVGAVNALAAEDPILSYGVGVLAASTDVAFSAPVGNDVLFSADDFARGLNLSRVDYVTVCSLPDVTCGSLMLGSTKIVAGQSISASNLAHMSYTAASDDMTKGSFTFTVNGGNVPMLCNLYLLEKTNYTPTVKVASDLSLNVSTYRGLSAYGTLSAHDPDGDELIFEIVSYPTSGSIKLLNRNLGSYVYTPGGSYSGSDRFTYVARDKYGNYSASATVQLRVALSGTSVTYADMQDSKSYPAALAMTESGVMSGVQVGNQYFFYPDKTVSRAEFLLMAMNASGINEVPPCANTAFADDADIPSAMKGYVATAYSLGYIKGTSVKGELCFLPNESITRVEAAVIVDAILDPTDALVIPTFADSSEIPTWARDAIHSLHAAGIMIPFEGEISATDPLTRAQAAELLAAVMAYLD